MGMLQAKFVRLERTGMNQTGKSMIAIAVTRVLRKYEEKGDIQAGAFARSPSCWVPGMSDDGGLGPIPQSMIDAIAEDVAKNIEEQLDAAESPPEQGKPTKPKRDRPDWLSVVEDKPVEEPEGEEQKDGNGGV